MSEKIKNKKITLCFLYEESTNKSPPKIESSGILENFNILPESQASPTKIKMNEIPERSPTITNEISNSNLDRKSNSYFLSSPRYQNSLNPYETPKKRNNNNHNFEESDRIKHLRATFNSFQVELTPVCELGKYLKPSNNESYNNNNQNNTKTTIDYKIINTTSTFSDASSLNFNYDEVHLTSTTKRFSGRLANYNINNNNNINLSARVALTETSVGSIHDQNSQNKDSQNKEREEILKKKFAGYRTWENFIWRTNRNLPEDNRENNFNQANLPLDQQFAQMEIQSDVSFTDLPSAPKIIIDKTVSTHFKLYTLSVISRGIFEAIFAYLQNYYFGFNVPKYFKCSEFPCPGDRVDCFISRSKEKTIFLRFMFGFTIVCVILNFSESVFLIYLFLTKFYITVRLERLRKIFRKEKVRQSEIRKEKYRRAVENSLEGIREEENDGWIENRSPRVKVSPVKIPKRPRKPKRKICFLKLLIKKYGRMPKFLKFSSFGGIKQRKYRIRDRGTPRNMTLKFIQNVTGYSKYKKYLKKRDEIRRESVKNLNISGGQPHQKVNSIQQSQNAQPPNYQTVDNNNLRPKLDRKNSAKNLLAASGIGAAAAGAYHFQPYRENNDNVILSSKEKPVNHLMNDEFDKIDLADELMNENIQAMELDEIEMNENEIDVQMEMETGDVGGGDAADDLGGEI